jgi:hypothetical protein
MAVLWRAPAEIIGPHSTTLFWLGGLGIVTLITVAFAVCGGRRQLAVLATILALGLPLTLTEAAPYRQLGWNSPLSFAALAGNINAYIIGLFVLVWWASSAGHERLAGVAAALATALKLGPIVLLWWFVVRRRWQSGLAFLVGLGIFVIVGLLFAGLPANLDYLRVAFGGGIRPQGFALADMLAHLFNVGIGRTSFATVVVLPLGLAAIYLLRRWPRAAFAAAIATAIYSSPVVLPGNLALFLAVAAPWELSADRTVGVRGLSVAIQNVAARFPRGRS